VRLNYDFGNVISHFYGTVRPEEDFLPAIPYTVHYHIKDVIAFDGGWRHTEVGKGSIDYGAILKTLVMKWPGVPASLEIPLRLTRAKDASPRRGDSPLPIDEIRGIVKGSFEYVENFRRGDDHEKIHQ
jgi:sugar phosphate isomerase/epimerase